MINTIIQRLGEHLQRQESDTAFLLIDPFLREPFPDNWEGLQDVPCWDVPIRHPAFSARQLPRLYRLEARNTMLLQASVVAAWQEQQVDSGEISNGFCIGGWLRASAGTDGAAIATRLAECMRQAQTSHSASPKVVRWQDRRVLEWMWPVLSAAQRRYLLGPLKDWTVLDRRGELQSLTAAPFDGNDVALALTADQVRHAHRGELAQDLLRGWSTFDDLPVDCLARVSTAAARLEALPELARQDRTLLGAYMLQIDQRLPEHVRVRALLDRVQAGQVTLSDALAEIPDPDGWDEIRADLMSSNSTQSAYDKDVHHG